MTEQTTAQATLPEDDEISLIDLAIALGEEKATILKVTGLFTALAVVASLLMTPIFTAKTVKIKPNPVVDVVHIESSVQIEKVQIFSLEGREVFSELGPFNSTTVDVRNLNAGVYFIALSAKSGKVTQKIIKK